MGPDDLLCSRNARLKKALVGRAQSRIDQATLENEGIERTRAVKGGFGHSLQDRNR